MRKKTETMRGSSIRDQPKEGAGTIVVPSMMMSDVPLTNGGNYEFLFKLFRYPCSLPHINKR